MINLKFIHMADMHFDMPFTVLNNRNKLGKKRRLEQREAFRRVIEYIKENSIYSPTSPHIFSRIP